MGEKDIAEKSLLELADVFADVNNARYFHGEQVIRPEDLESLPGASAYTHKGKLLKQERDVVKLWKPGGVCFALLGIENQTRPDPDIALRLMGYDGAAYRSQLSDRTLKSRFPVLTTVLHFGRTRWRAPKSLHERLTIQPELLPYIPDYRVNVMEVSFLTPDEIGLFKSDFRLIADYFVNFRLNKDYKGSPEQITHVLEFFQLMKVLTGDRRFDDMDFDTLPQGGRSMFSIIDRAENRGRVEGRAEGLIIGRAEGLVTGRAEGMITGRAKERAAMRENVQMWLNSGQITNEIAELFFSNLK